jgi:hypothetical protein
MVLIFFGFRVAVLFLMFHPVDRLTAKFNKWWSGGLEEHILAGMLSLRRIEGSFIFIYMYIYVYTVIDIYIYKHYIRFLSYLHFLILSSFFCKGQLVTFIAEKTCKNSSESIGDVVIAINSYKHAYDELFNESEEGFNTDKEIGVYPTDAEPFCLAWKDLSVLLKKKGTKLIDRVSGIARSGRVLALMGPSGAGKTTLLNALGNRYVHICI